ncbi:hypothetical protein FM076_02635 [Streptomyces albus subsp. chlorinus]|uniref:hypothetical protein n=1 Tax=Streptomyces albus TaxID=1888 RepID=UPI00156F6A8A|nr:hypothetical protein [Streptomyces albus]NSC20164.1 hypothetical protein [Streptomyces albus subsp. chlorinus]
MSTEPTRLPFPVRLYPRAYREANGAETAATYADATARASLPARIAEGAGIAAHALRMRTGLGSDRPFPQAAALAAPLVAAVAAGQSAAQLLRLPHTSPPGTLDGLHQLAGMSVPGAWITGLLWCLPLLAVLAGRWTAAKVFGVLAASAVAAARLAWFLPRVAEVQFDQLASLLLEVGLPQLLWAFLLVAAPRDLLDTSPPGRATLPVAALATYVTAAVGWRPGPLGVLVLAGAVVAVALAFTRRERLYPVAVLLAVLPVLLVSYTSQVTLWCWNAGLSYDATVAVTALPLAATVVGILLLNRRRAPDVQPPASPPPADTVTF